MSIEYTIFCKDASVIQFALVLTHQKLRWFLIHDVTQVLFLPINGSVVLWCCWHLTAGHIWLGIYPRLIILCTCAQPGVRKQCAAHRVLDQGQQLFSCVESNASAKLSHDVLCFRVTAAAVVWWGVSQSKKAWVAW